MHPGSASTISGVRETYFIGYAVDDSRQDGTPVSAAKSRDDAQALAIRRVLSLGITGGGIQVQSNDKLTLGEFEDLAAALDKWFAERGIP